MERASPQTDEECAVRPNELCPALYLGNKSKVSSDLFGFCSGAERHSIAHRKSIFEKGGKAVALKCCLVVGLVNTMSSQYFSSGSFMLS